MSDENTNQPIYDTVTQAIMEKDVTQTAIRSVGRNTELLRQLADDLEALQAMNLDVAKLTGYQVVKYGSDTYKVTYRKSQFIPEDNSYRGCKEAVDGLGRDELEYTITQLREAADGAVVAHLDQKFLSDDQKSGLEKLGKNLETAQIIFNNASVLISDSKQHMSSQDSRISQITQQSADAQRNADLANQIGEEVGDSGKLLVEYNKGLTNRHREIREPGAAEKHHADRMNDALELFGEANKHAANSSPTYRVRIDQEKEGRQDHFKKRVDSLTDAGEREFSNRPMLSKVWSNVTGRNLPPDQEEVRDRLQKANAALQEGGFGLRVQNENEKRGNREL